MGTLRAGDFKKLHFILLAKENLSKPESPQFAPTLSYPIIPNNSLCVKIINYAMGCGYDMLLVTKKLQTAAIKNEFHLAWKNHFQIATTPAW